MSTTRTVSVPKGIDSKEQLFVFWLEELQFPDYFSFNWDSFDEILSDLSWLPEERVKVVHADIPSLSKEDQKIYLELLIGAFREPSSKISSVCFGG